MIGRTIFSSEDLPGTSPAASIGRRYSPRVLACHRVWNISLDTAMRCSYIHTIRSFLAVPSIASWRWPREGREDADVTWMYHLRQQLFCHGSPVGALSFPREASTPHPPLTPPRWEGHLD
jgi:hypothetical protein